MKYPTCATRSAPCVAEESWYARTANGHRYQNPTAIVALSPWGLPVAFRPVRAGAPGPFSCTRVKIMYAPWWSGRIPRACLQTPPLLQTPQLEVCELELRSGTVLGAMAPLTHDANAPPRHDAIAPLRQRAMTPPRHDAMLTKRHGAITFWRQSAMTSMRQCVNAPTRQCAMTPPRHDAIATLRQDVKVARHAHPQFHG